MVDTQHFCLRWNNYQSSITSAFENLRDDEDFVDVTLACDGRSLKAHRVVLSACSPYFRELLKSTPCKHPVIVLQDVAFNDLHALVEFIYHGEVNVHQRSLSSFLKTAEVLRVSGLTQQQAEESHNLAQIQSLGNSGARTPISHHGSFTDKMVEDALFPQGVSPPPHLNNLHSSNPHQLLRRAAAAAAALRRERNNSSQSEELSLKRQRSDNGNNNSPDVISHMPQVTAADFSTIKHNNNNTPPMKDAERAEDYSSDNPNNLSNNNASNGNGLSSSSTDKDSLTPSPPNRMNDNVKSEPMELFCSNHNLPSDEQSNDSVGDNDIKYLGGNDGKGSLSSNNDDDIENSLHSHTAPPFLMGPNESKLFSTPGSFNFSMAALAADSAALAGLNSHLQSAAELAGSPQGVADGVGGWRSYGIDPGEFSSFLMRTCERLVESANFNPKQPVSLLSYSYCELLEQKKPILENSTVYTANIGDSGFIVVRKGQIIHRSEEQQHYFNTPFQLSLPPPGQNVLSDSPDSADTLSFPVENGDVILAATDGVFDNVPTDLLLDILKTCEGESNPVKLQMTANAIALMARSLSFDSEFMSPFSVNARRNNIHATGGKPDDITVVLATVAT